MIRALARTPVRTAVAVGVLALSVGCGNDRAQGTTQGIGADGCRAEMSGDAVRALGGGGVSSYRVAVFAPGIQSCEALADDGPVDRITVVRARASQWTSAKRSGASVTDDACEQFTADGGNYVIERVNKGALFALTGRACSDGAFTAVGTESLSPPKDEAGLRELIRLALVELHPGSLQP